MSNISKINISNEAWNKSDASLICIGIYKDSTMTPIGSDIDKESGGAISIAFKSGDMSGKVGEINFFYVCGKRIAVIGMGDKKKIKEEIVREAAGRALRIAIDKKSSQVLLDCLCSGVDSCQSMGEGIALGSYQFLNYKTKKAFERMKKKFILMFVDDSRYRKCRWQVIENYKKKLSKDERNYLIKIFKDYFLYLIERDYTEQIYVVTHPHKLQLITDNERLHLSLDSKNSEHDTEIKELTAIHQALDHENLAIQCSLGMRTKLNELNEIWNQKAYSKYWKNHGIDKITARTGVHTGNVIVGNIGSDRMLQYSIIGDTVNVASRLEQVNKETDSTYLLALESLKRGYKSMYCNPTEVSINQNELIVEVSDLELKNSKIQIKYSSKKIMSVSDFDVVLIRQDPPFNMEYITNSYLLSISNHKEAKKPLFINNPEGIRNFSEKIYPLYFKKFIPDTTISSRENIIAGFIKKNKKVVVKPLYEKGGDGIFMLDEKNKNIKKIIKKSTQNYTKPLIFQKYLSAVKKGDKRILLINGRPVGCVNRVPLKGSFIANLHLGSKAKKTSLTNKEIQICKELEPSLIKNGFFFVGIDIIDQKLTEINVTSPTGIKHINELSGLKIEEEFWDEVIKKIS